MTTDFRSSNQSLFEITREFGSGSRPAPDPFDRFLEELGFYRKHTARDSSSLFRCVSEQVYDVQGHHERVRAECVQFMRENEELFQAAVKKMNFDYQCYLKNLSESRTRGSVLELQAMGLLYQCNVMLFEPLSEGQWTATPNETWSRSIRVFFTKPGHFDSIFTRNYIQKAAYCQALVYEILYKNVFLLPDVDFAVEKMLHDRDEGMKFSEDKVVTFDGRIMTFDTPETTQCALSDYRFCHFHNRAGFEFEIEKYRQQKEKKNKHGHNLDLFLYDKDISCVRQLMKIGMTPFPYKVAKALDPSIYRNVEFDTWVLIRRERMYKDWYFGGNDFKIGVKCLLKRYDSTDSYNICFIQEMSTDKSLCTVFVEGSAEKITVPLSALRELPYEQSSWGCPKKQRQIEHKLRQFSKERSLKSADVGKRNLVYHKLAKRLTIEDLTSLKYFKAEPQHIIALPVFDTKKKGFKAAPEPALEDKFDFLDSSEDFNRSPPTAADSGFTQELNSSDQSQNLEPPQVSYQAIPHLGVPPPPIEGAPYYSQFQIPPPTFHLQMETQLWSEPPPTTTIVNFGVLQSICLDGSDLPFNDISTLRFFFNYGIQEYNKTQSLARPSYNTDSEAQIPQPNSDQEVHKLTSSLENTHVYDSQSLESSNVNEHAQKNEFNGFAQHQNQINYRRDGHGRGRRPFRGRGNRQQYGDSRYFYRSSARNTGEAPRDDILGRQNTSVVESNSYGAQTPQTPPTTYFVQHSGDAAAIAPQTPASTVLYYYPQQPFVPYFNYMQPPPMIPQHFPQTPAVPVYDYAQPAFPAADTSGISSISGSEPARHPFVYSAFGQNMSLGVYTPQGQANFVPSSGWNSGQNS